MEYSIGSRVVANCDFWDLISPKPSCRSRHVQAGDHGTVVDVDPEMGDISILMDREIPELKHLNNRILVQFENVDVRIKPEREAIVFHIAEAYESAASALRTSLEVVEEEA
jgi:hypothetical protein